MASTKRTIHVLGGGPSGLSTAFHLTSPAVNPSWRNEYDVVVHQLGWRLGGKGATGRPADKANRIEEHGIHLFGNMYSNSLHMMAEALAELDDGRTMETEFLPSDFQLVTDFYRGRWHGFDGGLPHNGENPWEHGPIAGPEALAQSMLATIEGILSGQELPYPGGDESGAGPERSWVAKVIGKVVGFVTRLLTPSEKRIIAKIMKDVEGSGAELDAASLQEVLNAVEDVLDFLEKGIARLATGDDELRWIYVQLDLLATAMRGLIADDLLTKGIDSIDHVDYRTWLRSHGASDLLMSSSLLQAIPNTCMQYPDGDSTTMPQMAASAYLTFILRQILAPGDAAYFFKVSTGETIILPLYQVLKQRGVRFEFFHKVLDLVPSADGSRIESIELEVQASTIGGEPYDPLRTLPDGQLVWPSAPNYDQLEQGHSLQGVNLESWWADWKGRPETIQLGPDDYVVVALPPKAQRYVCATAANAEPGWRKMLEEVRTTATQALQIWLSRPLDDLGWRKLEKTNRWLGPTYTNPISAFGDFSDVLPYETWPADNRPQGLIYFCGVLQDPATVPEFSDHAFPAQQHQRVGDMAAQYLRQLGGLLPGAAAGGIDANSLDFAVLHAYDEATAGTGEARVQQQYFRANIDPNERYTVSVPGTLQYRLKAWESGYANCALSSDAIYTGFNIGSFEGAVMSGMLATLALIGAPGIQRIYGYDFLHPDAKGPDRPLIPGIQIDLTQVDLTDQARARLQGG